MLSQIFDGPCLLYQGDFNLKHRNTNCHLNSFFISFAIFIRDFEQWLRENGCRWILYPQASISCEDADRNFYFFLLFFTTWFLLDLSWGTLVEKWREVFPTWGIFSSEVRWISFISQRMEKNESCSRSQYCSNNKSYNVRTCLNCALYWYLLQWYIPEVV